MIFESPLPFSEALQSRQVKALLPSDLSSREWMEIAPELRERALFSARTTNAEYLQRIDDLVEDLLNPRTIERDGAPVTAGVDPATARLELKKALQEIGYAPTPEERGTLRDLGSDARLNLVLKTNLEMAQGYGHFIEGNAPDVLDAFPAWELVRYEERKEPRDWIMRWRGAGGALVGGGRMVALKDDPIWTEISAFGLPYPPFDFNSGMGVLEVSREEAMALGLIDRDAQVQPQTRGFNDLLQSSPEVRNEALRASLLEGLGDGFTFEGDTLRRAA